MMGLNEWLKKNTFKGAFGGLFDDYDLKQCVTMGRAIGRHFSKVSTIFYVIFMVISVVVIASNEIAKLMDGAGFFVKDNPSALVIAFSLLSFICVLFGYSVILSNFQSMLKKRIRVIAGVSDNGEETQS